MHEPLKRGLADRPPTPDDALDAFAARVAGPLRDAEPAGTGLRAHVMASVRADAARARERRGAGAWWRRSFTLRLTPVTGLALAAGIAAVALVGAEVLREARHVGTAPAQVAAAGGTGAPAAHTDTLHVVRFVIVAPEAASIALVGDFNGWDRSALQLTRHPDGDDVWTATVSLPAGRHEYAFVVDGERWVADPNAPTTAEDEFGVRSSVVTVRPTGPGPTRSS